MSQWENTEDYLDCFSLSSNWTVSSLSELMARAPLFLLVVLAMPAALKFSFNRPSHVTPEKIPTYPCQVDDQMGWSYGEENP